jgi:serine/threonine protein kinase
MNNFYDKDDRVTDYLCSRQTLDLIVDAVVKSVISIANEINPAEIKIKKKIYTSALCTVHSGLWKRQPVAVKIFDPNGLSYNRINFIKEITMFTLIKHPNACPFYGAFTPPKIENSGDVKLLERPLILMPLFKNGSLENYINARKQTLIDNKQFEKRQVIDNMTLFNMAINASFCIQFLHSRSIIHRDIKPANFLLDDNFVIRVTDFGVSRAMTDISKGEYTYSGTEVWMAPEVFDKFYDQKVDVYSFGLVLWTMLTGKTPYEQYDDLVTFTTVISHGFREKIPEFTPPVYPELAHLIVKCWDADYRRRPEFREIFESLCNMKLSLTQRPFTHLFYSLEEKEYQQLLGLIESFMDNRSRISFSLTNSKFYQIFKSIDNVNIRM